MAIIDSQVHVYEANIPTRPWRQGVRMVSEEGLVATIRLP